MKLDLNVELSILEEQINTMIELYSLREKDDILIEDLKELKAQLNLVKLAR